MRAALYLRVSSDRQTVENQRAEVEQLARARGYEIALYEETESAAKRRPVFERMLTDVRAGRIDAVVVWAIDRLHRSMQGAINDVLELDRLGVRVLSVREPWLDTSGPVRSLLVAIFGWVAEQERSRLIERTKAGLERAKTRRQAPRPSSLLPGPPSRSGGPRSSWYIDPEGSSRVEDPRKLAAAVPEAVRLKRLLRCGRQAVRVR